MDFNIENIINEAYIGKSANLIAIEKELNKLRSYIKPNTPNNSKEILNINKLVEKQFGMHLFGLMIDTTSYDDAYTYNLGGYYDYALNEPYKYVTGDKVNGYRFTRDNKFTVMTYISYGMLSNKDYTDAELVAILLHEIGHNFGDCIYDKLYIANADLVIQYRKALLEKIKFGIILAPFTIGISLLLTAKYIKMYNDDSKAVKKNSNLIKKNRKYSMRVRKFFDSLKSKRSDTKSKNNAVAFRRDPDSIKNIDNYYLSYSDEYKSSVRKSNSTQSEVFADKFAGVYGYGTELSTALAKMNRIATDIDYKAARRAAKGNKYYQQLNDDISIALLKLRDLDCHPELIQRINSNIELLKKEYSKSDLDPDIKKEILMQIDDMQKLIDDLIDAQNKIYHIDKAQALYNQKINDQLPSAVDQELEDAIDDALDKALESGEKKYNKK